MIAVISAVYAETSALDLRLKSDSALSERQFFEDGKLDFLSYYLTLQKVRLVLNQKIATIAETDRNRLLNDLDSLSESEQHLINEVIFSENNQSVYVNLVVRNLNHLSLDPQKLEAYLYKPLIEAILEKYQASGLDYIAKSDLFLLNQLLSKIRSAESSGLYRDLIGKTDFSQQDLIAIQSIGSSSARIVYFDLKHLSLESRLLIPGNSFAGFTVEEILDDRIVLQSNSSMEKITLFYLSQGREKVARSTAIVRKYRICFMFDWYDSDNSFYLKRGSQYNLYLKVVDSNNQIVKESTVSCNGQTWSSNPNGVITCHLKFDPSDPEQSLTFTSPEAQSATFKFKLNPIDAFFTYNASAVGTAGIGGDVLAFDVTGAVHPGYKIGVRFMCPDVSNKNQDSVVYTINPSLGASLSASLGPKLQPFKIQAFDYNLGAGAQATVSGSIKVIAGINQAFQFYKPYSDDRKAQVVLFADKMMDFVPVAKPIMSSLFAKMSGVKTTDYMTEASLTLAGETSLSGNIGAQLGLVNNQDAVTGANLEIVSGTATFNTGIEGGILSGMTEFGPTTDRYSVCLKSGLSGSFSAAKLSARIFKTSIMPDYFLMDNSGSLGLNFIFRFDQNMKFTRSYLILSTGYLIRNNIYHQFVKDLIRQVHESGGASSDYAELMKISGVDKKLILILDKDKTKQFFGQWLAFAQALLKNNDQQNGDTVVAKVTGMFGAVNEALDRMVDCPVVYVKKTNLILDTFRPGFNLELSAGVKIKLGVSTQFSKCKEFQDEFGYFSRFRFLPVEDAKYCKELARADRDVAYLMGSIKDYVMAEVSNTATYIYQKASDGTVYIVQKVSDGAVYVIKQGVDGTVTIVKKTGEEAKKIWNSVLNAVGNAAQYVYDQGSTVINTVGDTLSGIWHSIWG